MLMLLAPILIARKWKSSASRVAVAQSVRKAARLNATALAACASGPNAGRMTAAKKRHALCILMTAPLPRPTCRAVAASQTVIAMAAAASVPRAAKVSRSASTTARVSLATVAIAPSAVVRAPRADRVTVRSAVALVQRATVIVHSAVVRAVRALAAIGLSVLARVQRVQAIGLSVLAHVRKDQVIVRSVRGRDLRVQATVLSGADRVVRARPVIVRSAQAQGLKAQQVTVLSAVVLAVKAVRVIARSVQARVRKVMLVVRRVARMKIVRSPVAPVRAGLIGQVMIGAHVVMAASHSIRVRAVLLVLAARARMADAPVAASPSWARAVLRANNPCASLPENSGASSSKLRSRTKFARLLTGCERLCSRLLDRALAPI